MIENKDEEPSNQNEPSEAFINAIKANQIVRPHRCTLRVKDFVHSFTHFSLRNTLHTFRIFIKCMWANPGEEPKDPILFLPPEEIEKYEESERAGNVRSRLFERTSTPELLRQIKEYERHAAEEANEKF
mmetsp:Transcript_6543/g.9512  ORF Transcript_6543/g.9512 Transcript_6543/m.9512 type:complete len:129 (-) Transcript_6543:675-1061(-)